MRIKLMKFMSFLLCIFGVFSVMFFIAPKTYAMEANITDFSSYVNCFKGDVYTTPTLVSPLTRTNYYNIGTKCYAKYAEKTITGTPRMQNYGFKINGEFFVSPIMLDKNGTYLIETYPYEKINGIIKPKGKVALESIYVTVDLDYKVSLKKTIYTYDAYDTPNAFLEAVENNFNEDVVISAESVNLLKNTFISCKNNKDKRTVKISCMFENVTYPFDIIIGPSTDESIDDFVDLGKAVLNVKGIASMYSSSNRGDSVSNALRGLITERVNDDLNLSVEQSVDINFLNSPTYPTLNSVDYRFITLELEVQDTIVASNSAIFNVYVLIYQTSYIKDSNLMVNFDTMDYLETQENINTHASYLKFTDNNIDYYDYEVSPSVSGSVDMTNKRLTYTVAYNGITKSRTESINVVSVSATAKIVTNYNYIVLSKKESLEYKDQTAVLVGSRMLKALETNEYFFKYEIMEENNADFLIIKLFETSTNKELDSKKVKIYYKKSQDENIFLKFLELYGNFLKNIF